MFRQRLRDGRLAVARWSRQQNTVPRLYPVRAQQIGAVLFFNELPDLLLDRQGQDQIIEMQPRRRLQNGVFAVLGSRLRDCWRAYRNAG